MSLFAWPVRSLSRRSFVSSSHLSNSAPDTTNGSHPSQKDALPPLARPLGVRERPTILVRNTVDRLKDLMDPDTRMAQRRHLIKEASFGYFHDLNMTRKHGGKTWLAPKVLIREDKALYLPNISGKSLDTGATENSTEMCFGKITILAMLGTRVSEINAKGFVDPAHARYASHPLYQYVQVNLQENILKSLLVNMFLTSLRRVIPHDLQSTYLVSTQNMEYLRDALGMTNSRVGYVFLVDENLKIRWGGCADATDEEVRSLEGCTGVLLKRLERDKLNVGHPSTSSQPLARVSTQAD